MDTAQQSHSMIQFLVPIYGKTGSYQIFHILFNNLQAIERLLPHLEVFAAVADSHPMLEKTQGFPVIDASEVNALNAHSPGHLELGVQEIRTITHPQGVIGNEKGRDAITLFVPALLTHGGEKRIEKHRRGQGLAPGA